MNNHVKLIIRSWSITSRKSRQWRQWRQWRHGESSHTTRQESDHSQSRHTNWLNYVSRNHVKLQSCHTNWHQIIRNHVTPTGLIMSLAITSNYNHVTQTGIRSCAITSHVFNNVTFCDFNHAILFTSFGEISFTNRIFKRFEKKNTDRNCRSAAFPVASAFVVVGVVDDHFIFKSDRNQIPTASKQGQHL